MAGYRGAIQIVAHVIRGNYFAFDRANGKYGDLCSLPAIPVMANPQGEAIQCPRMDCFTLRVRHDVRDNLNCTRIQFLRKENVLFADFPYLCPATGGGYMACFYFHTTGIRPFPLTVKRFISPSNY
jgi:hypothetical protein